MRHHIDHHGASVHAGNWANCRLVLLGLSLIELEGKTISIIGFGRIGQAEAGSPRPLV